MNTQNESIEISVERWTVNRINCSSIKISLWGACRIICTWSSTHSFKLLFGSLVREMNDITSIDWGYTFFMTPFSRSRLYNIYTYNVFVEKHRIRKHLHKFILCNNSILKGRVSKAFSIDATNLSINDINLIIYLFFEHSFREEKMSIGNTSK